MIEVIPIIYIKYIVFASLQLICMCLCYITNPFVVLFADNEGELPTVFKLWQTWDSALDNRQYVLCDCPKWLSYDFDEYYDAYYGVYRALIGYGRYKKMVRLKKPFPKSLWLKHYFNRVFWLYRNCGYGFAFYLFGVDTNPATISKKSEHYSTCSNAFRYKNDSPINKYLKWCIYMGWKYDFDKPCRAMIATRFTVHRRRE